MAVTKSWSLCLLILEETNETKKRCKVYKGKVDLVEFCFLAQLQKSVDLPFRNSPQCIGCFIFSAGPMSLLPMFCATSLRSGNMGTMLDMFPSNTMEKVYSTRPGDHGLCRCHDLCHRTARLGHSWAVATLFGDPSADAGWGTMGSWYPWIKAATAINRLNQVLDPFRKGHDFTRFGPHEGARPSTTQRTLLLPKILCQGPDLMASMAVFHAAHVASASLLCWALRGAMVKATDGFCAVQGALYNLYISLGKEYFALNRLQSILKVLKDSLAPKESKESQRIHCQKTIVDLL